MDFMGENIDKIFREGLRDYEVTPPYEVWEGVLQARTYKRRILPVFRYAAAVVAMLLVVGSLFTIINKPKSVKSVALNLQNEKAIVRKNLQKDNSLPIQGIVSARKGNNKLVEKAVREKTDAEKLFIAETQIYTINKESQDIPSVKVLQISEPVNTRNKTKIFLLAENYYPIESKSLSSFVDGKSLTLNSKVVYSDKELPVIYDFANEPIDQKIENNGGWSFGAKFSPLYTSRNVTMTMPGNFKEMYDNVEEGIIAFSGGFNFKYKSANRISVHVGLFYSRMGQKITDLVAYDVPAYIVTTLPVKPGLNKITLNSSFGPVVVPETSLYVEDITVARVENKYSSDYFDPVKLGLEGFDAEISQSFEYIEIPLLLSYKVIDRVIGFQLLGGVSTNLLVGNNVYAEFDGQRINMGITDDIYKFNYSSVVGFGIEYGFSDQLTFSIEPTFKYYLNSFSSGTRIHVHPFSVGLFSGISYKF